MATQPPKFTPAAKVDPSTKKSSITSPSAPTKIKSTKKDRKERTGRKSKGSKTDTSDTPNPASYEGLPEPQLQKIITDKDKEISTLKSKIKKYESELRRSDDTILVQEEEIKRLNKKLEVAGTPSDTQESAEDNSEGKGRKKRPSANREARKKSSDSGKSGGSSARKNDNYPLYHYNLREGTMKDAFSDLQMNIVGASSGSGSTSAHAYVVAVRCPLFDKALKERYGGKEKKKKVPKKKALDLRGSDAVTINRLLDYLYSDECYNLAKMKPSDLLNLVIAARRYSLDRLIWIIENEILRILSLDNVVTFLKIANELKDERIRKFCIDFLLLPDMFKDFVLRKDLTSELGMDLFSEVVTLNATQAALGPKAMETLGACPSPHIREDFKDLFNNMLYADACVNLGGESIQFHKAILAAGSKHIYENFSKAKVTSGQLEDVSECLELTRDQRFYEKVSPESFRALLRFLYYGDTDIDAMPACLLIPFVKFYGMNEMQELCEKKIQQSVTNSKVVLKIMGVTYLAIMAAREDMRDRLRRECINHCMTHLKDINLGEIRNFESEYALQLALDLLLAAQKTFAK